MSKTPDNHVLSSKTSAPAVTPSQPPGPPASQEYPKAVFHRDSKPGNLVSKVVNNREEEAALGDEWSSLAELNIETAPAVPAPDQPAPDKKEPHGD